jgi:high potential iron-sulfur protein
MTPSRRILLKNIAVLAVVPLIARPAHAQAKASKQAMKYQDQPNNGQQCDTCVQYVPGANAKANGTCKVVEGPISPKGWCIAYVKKS